MFLSLSPCWRRINSGKCIFLSNICMDERTNMITDSGPSQGQNFAFLAIAVDNCVCVFLYLLYTEYQNAYSATNVRTFLVLWTVLAPLFSRCSGSLSLCVFHPGWEGLKAVSAWLC